MKALVTATLFSGLLCAQPPQPVQVTPGTPAVKAPPQATPATPPAPAAIAPTTIVMEANGKKYTAAEVDHLIALLPPQYQQPARSQPQMLTTLLVYQKLAEDAEKAGRDKESPLKEQLEFSRLQLLANSELTLQGNSYIVSPADQAKYYKDHPEKFQEAKVRVIYIAFNPTPGKAVPGDKQLLGEAEAKVKIVDLRSQIVAGADFGKLARENSDDATSAPKDGDFGTIKHSSPYPDAIKNAVFALKPGELSQPIKERNGFYLIRLDAMQTQSYDEVNPDIAKELRQEHFNEWTKALQTQFGVKVENPGYFRPQAPPQLQQVR
ncbi:MAG: peptidylprolyl isomerase [Acidobacteriia bacterium]|nr:peptidylprolyl isomerase [Terriglobia bacterium]